MPTKPSATKKPKLTLPKWDLSSGYDHPSYTHKIFRPDEFRKLVLKAEKKLLAIHQVTPFEAIAGTGNSAMPLLGALSYKMGVPMIAVRKDGEKRHDDRNVNGRTRSRYVIVDDLIDSGATVDRIVGEIAKASSYTSTLVAVVLYEQGSRNYFRTFKSGKSVPVYALGTNSMFVHDSRY